MMRNFLGVFRSWWRSQQFEPGRFGVFANPFFFARRGLLVALKPLLPRLKGRLLDIGCGRKPYRRFIPATEYVGLDVSSPATRALGVADVYYAGDIFPFRDHSFDCALCSQVFEHIFNPPGFLAEISRILKPGGQLLLTVPFVWDEHEQPVDFARYSSFGLRFMLEKAGFEIIEQRKSVTDISALFQIATAWLYKVLRSKRTSINVLCQVLVIAPINILGAFAALFLPRNNDFYLDNVILAKKLPSAH